ncbi:MAG: FAD-binding protein, partial [Halofilum sp. (in: g-proteobacteria)]
MATNAPAEEYAARRERLQKQFRAAHGGVRLDKDTSNLFRDRTPAAGARLDVRDFHHVLSVDPAAGTVDVEGMTPYHVLVDACLEHGVMPAVVPELRSITIGGAVSGVGIESSSFRYGLVHATMQEAEVLTGDGSIVTARADNEHADLFLGLPNSYGTLGYALRLQVAVVPVRPYVHLHHERFEDAESFFRALEADCEAGEADFIDGTAF